MNSETGLEESQMIADFSQLPDVTWVQILQHLSLADRYRVSVTCRALYEVFRHPSLWHTQRLCIYGDQSDYPNPYFKGSVLNSFLKVTKHFGKYFQNLTIKVNGHLCDLHQELGDVLLEVGKQCRLETLTIDVGILTSEFHQMYIEPPSTSAILALSSFVKNAYRLRHLHIRSWPLYPEIDNEDCNIMKAITRNDKLQSLETLTLFMTDGKGWSERMPCLISSEETLNILAQFHNLTHIGLRTPMLNEEIIEMLADPERAKLKLFKIFVHYLRIKQQFAVPVISSRVWKVLHNRNPDLRIEITIFLQTPHLELANFVKPEIAISSITYMKYAKIDPSTLTLLYNHNCDTLTSFYSYCDSYALDEDLIQLVKKCKFLVEFVYHGEIHLDTVVNLAKLRGDAWKKFEVARSKIQVPDEYADLDPDQVIAPDGAGNLVLVELMRHHRSEGEIQEAVDAMAAEVSNTLGYAWQPSNGF